MAYSTQWEKYNKDEVSLIFLNLEDVKEKYEVLLSRLTNQNVKSYTGMLTTMWCPL